MLTVVITTIRRFAAIHRFKLTFFNSVVLCLSAFQQAAAGTIVVSGEPFTLSSHLYIDTTLPFPGIIATIEASPLHYEIAILPAGDNALVSLPTMRYNDFYRVEDDSGGITLFRLSLPDSVKTLHKLAESAFARAVYDSAMMLYQLAYAMDTSDWLALTYIGNFFYVQDQFDSAGAYFREAIDKNFIDYQAHWFLADTYWELGFQDSAITELTLAHVLNIGHVELFNNLRSRRELIGRPWRFTDYRPQFKIDKRNDTVFITCPARWFGYAAIRAFWKFEPGYAMKISGDSVSSDLSPQMVRQAIFAQLAWDPSDGIMDMLAEIAQSGFYAEFIFYEIMLREIPAMILVVPREVIGTIVEYLDHHH